MCFNLGNNFFQRRVKMGLKLFIFFIVGFFTFFVLGWSGVMQIRLNESKKLKNNEKVQIKGTDIVIFVEGVGTLRTPDNREISLVTLIISEKQQKTQIIIEKNFSAPGFKLYKNYKIIVEDASGLQSYCVIKIQKQG